MPGEQYGEWITLAWPDGNDNGEFFMRGHIGDEQARQRAMQYEEIEAHIEEAARYPDDSDALDAAIEHRVAHARVELLYARWSQEASIEEPSISAVLRLYREPGRGRFPVTRVMLAPPTPCCLSVRTRSDVYTCRVCGRCFEGPVADPTPASLDGPSDCAHLRGDEIFNPTPVYRELAPIHTNNTEGA